jgi:selenocysteine-specific elongation factor
MGDRFILRYPSPPQTIGGGVVLDPHPPHRWRRFKAEVIRRFETLAAGTPDQLLLQALEEQIALTPRESAGLTGLQDDAVTAAADVLVERGDVLLISGGWLMARASWTRLSELIIHETAAYHREYPLRVGMPREALRSRLKVEGKLFGAIIHLAVEDGHVVDEGTMVRLPDHAVVFSTAQQAAIDRLFAQFDANPAAPPSVKEVVALVGEDVLEALVSRGDVVQVSSDVVFTSDTFDTLVGQVEAYIVKHGSITVAQARDLFGTSRKYVLALLEYLDGIGVSRRVGDARELRRPPQ